MDKDTQERIDMITGMIMAITNMQENDVEDLIKGTIVYRNIVRGEECTLYEDYSANLMDIVKELKKKNVRSSICGITSVEISDLNQWMFSNDIEDARQLKENNYRSHIIEAEVATDILDKDMLGVKVNKRVGVPINMILGGLRKKNVMQYGAVAYKTAKGTHHGYGKARKKRAVSYRTLKRSAKSNRKNFGI